MSFFSMFFGNPKNNNMKTISISSGAPQPASSFSIPTDLKDFKEWHYKALRRLDGHFVNDPFSGLISMQVDFSKFVPILINMGLLYIGNWQQSLVVLKNDELKNILSKYSLKQTGKKSDLIARICDNLTQDQVVSAGYGKLAFFHTDAGKDAIEKSYAILEAEELAYFSAHFKMIYDGDLDRAYRSICMRNASLPVSPGIGFDWRKAASLGIPQKDYSQYISLLNTAKNRGIAAVSVYCSISGESESAASAMYSKMLSISSKE